MLLKQSDPTSSPIRLLLTGGGSGGPTTPLLAVWEKLKQETSTQQCCFWGTASGPERAMVEAAELPFISLPSGKLRRYWSTQNFVDCFNITAAFFVSFAKLIKLRPHSIVSAGSFVSVPVAYAAWLLRIPHIILQMDARPGLANRLMAPVSKVIAYHFDVTASKFPKHAKKIGVVIRESIRTASANRANELFNLKPDKALLVVTGGGQGAAGLNKAIKSVLDYWLEEFQVVHLTGRGQAQASSTHEDYHATEFVSEGMGDLLARSEIVVSRAGMGILGELAYLKKDTVLVPLPHSHQELNAQILQDQNAVAILSQEEFQHSGEAWWKNFLENRVSGELGANLHKALPDGTDDFVQLILQQHPSSS